MRNVLIVEKIGESSSGTANILGNKRKMANNYSKYDLKVRDDDTLVLEIIHRLVFMKKKIVLFIFQDTSFRRQNRVSETLCFER
jgi:hypothetical protein